jgi:hypothetical protein
MSASVRYGAFSVALIGLLTLGLWPFLDAAGRMGVLVAAAVATPIQVGAFVAILVIRSGSASAIPMLLALAGFFFALLLLEPVCFKAAPRGHGKVA